MSTDFRAKYFTRTESAFPDEVEILGVTYVKVEDLRYGTNPHQGASFYRPKDSSGMPFGHMEVLKTGKSGLSETNYGDLNHGANIVKYFDRPACAIMKHLNPSGVAVSTNRTSVSQGGTVGYDPLSNVYVRARDADAVAAFGCTAVFNTKVDAETAKQIMTSVVEVVAAPDFEPEAVEILSDYETYKMNKDIRVIRLPNLMSLPKWVGEPAAPTIKVLADGSLVVAEPLLTSIKSGDDLVIASTEHPKHGKLSVEKFPTQDQIEDLLFSWYVNLSVRSNGVVIAKNGVTLAVGTGQQDRVAAVRQAIAKAREKFKGSETLEGAVLSSDAFFPFRDSVDACAEAGISAIIQPGGSVRDWESIEACNEHGIAMVFTGERCFSHH
ncbi:MAG: IMP cyclohydrolase [Armatimonadetes bacterium]|nr:IMP cyclohydrolase [Armatimonadota bacterium]